MRSLFAIPCLGFSLAACASVGPVPAVDPGIEPATLAGAPIEFHLEAEPLDAGVPLPGGLTLAEAVRRGLDHDPRLQAALARVRAAQADASQARLLPNPVLSFSLKFPTAGGPPGLELGLSQALGDLFRRGPRAGVADAHLHGAATECLAVALDVLREVEEQYVEIQAVEARAPLLADLLRLLEENRKLAQTRLDAGEGVRSDVTSLEAEIADAAIEQTELEAKRREHRLALARLIGKPSSATDWPVDAMPAMSLEIPPEKACIDTALARRPEPESGRWDLAALEAERRLAGLAVLDGLEGGVDAEGTEDWSVGPSGSIPIPVFDSGEAGRSKADADLVEARHRLNQVRRTVVEEVRQAWWAIENSRRSLSRIRDELIPVQERRRSEIEAAFRVGEQDVTALLVASQDLQAARVRRLEAEAEIARARVRLERAVGGPAALRDATKAATPK